ncbi:unnamed protein product [Rotaria magnacalcarata]|uniref:Ubiquitin carboxyl-terminal hydrolase n=1 Tax=Rotaria magnacalcarata TaxID=392030 RepID=A0A816U6B8_9BILA|nr:unnamed protein product [Rotaria magnacalcarata]
MRSCFGMKPKKERKKQKNLIFVSVSRFKHSEHRTSSLILPIKRENQIGETVAPLTTNSSYKENKTDKSSTPFRRVFEKNELSRCIDNTLPPIIPSPTLKTTETTDSNTTSYGTSKPKLPPIPSDSSISLSDNKLLSTDHSIIFPDRPISDPCGLKNIGNTCYMNSAIQCLNSIPDLIKWIMEQPCSSSHMNIREVFISLIQSMQSGRYKYVTPHELKQYIGRTSSIFSDNGQKDSHEFMNSLLNAIGAVDSSSEFVKLFRIHTKSLVTCSKCQQTDNTDETTTFLPLTIPERISYDDDNILLEHLIRDFCQEDELDGEYYCYRCKTCQSARQKTIIIQPLPRALIIQLKRFPYDGTSRKLNTLVKYKLEHRNLLSRNDRYELCAISMHSGNLAGGHYTAIGKNDKTKKWHRFDDSYVENIESQTLLVPFIATQAYILIYVLKHNDEEINDSFP